MERWTYFGAPEAPVEEADRSCDCPNGCVLSSNADRRRPARARVHVMAHVRETRRRLSISLPISPLSVLHCAALGSIQLTGDCSANMGEA